MGPGWYEPGSMAWTKIPAEHHPLFLEALPRDPKVTTIKMFGGLAGLVNGHMFAGLFGRSAIAKLGPDDHTAALKLDGAERFDPMGNGRVMSNTVLLPESVMDEPAELRHWLARALDYARTLPAKKKKKPTAKVKRTPSTRSRRTPAPKRR